MSYSKLGSSMGGCGVPSNADRYTVKDPTNYGNGYGLGVRNASGSYAGGYYYSPIETRQANRYYWVDGKKKYY